MKGLSVGILIAALTLISSASLPAPIARAAQQHFTMSMTKQKSKSDRSAKADEKYDFVCRLDALDANERKRHSELTKLLKSGIKQTLELKDGYALQLPSDTASVLATTEWVTMERRCCEFFNFELELESGDGAFWLRITGRKGVKDFLRSELGLKAN